MAEGTSLASEIQSAFSLDVTSVSGISGGDIAQAYKVMTADGLFFAKIMPGSHGTKVLSAEKYSLEEIGNSGALRTPKIYGIEQRNGKSILLMEYIQPGRRTPEVMKALGKGLAKLHLLPQDSYGWASDNFIGSLPQHNSPAKTWPEFYATQRLQPLFKMARDRGVLERSEIPSAETLEKRIRQGMPEVHPSLLHGDLWGGNYLISEEGAPYLIDPASYYGHSEVDLAMSRLFGGFSSAFYEAYREIIPDVPGWERRIGLYQLYYLLVHLILFGESYAPAVRKHSRDWFGS